MVLVKALIKVIDKREVGASPSGVGEGDAGEPSQEFVKTKCGNGGASIMCEEVG